ncbi:hypothetical protein NQ315_003341 [Exocentrus adspersus]|uniref:Receptor ligand binding region domain-containing protein n=1 Tax=Exocentrus adspersus TaxID=1586481 RepID=A0AAV8V7W4_9CUCU|nr:hypothetical protein NQ315_003341 [Exocentrus adspersus]
MDYVHPIDFCTHAATSDKSKFPTFARTRPPDTQISKSVASVLTAFNWTHGSRFFWGFTCSCAPIQKPPLVERHVEVGVNFNTDFNMSSNYSDMKYISFTLSADMSADLSSPYENVA